MLQTDSIVEYLRTTTRSTGFACYWLEYGDGRTKLCRDIEDALSDLPILAIPVEAGSFNDANGITDDICQVLETERDWFAPARRKQIISLDQFSVVLVSRRPLGLPQLSSPVQLPDWFPAWPGHLLTIRITSITDLVDMTLDHPSIPIGRVRAGLFAIEQTLCRRLTVISANSPDRLEALWTRLKAGAKNVHSSPSDDLWVAKNAQAGISEADAFRPSGGIDSDFVVSKLFRIWWKSSPDDLHNITVDISNALALDGSFPRARQFSFASLLTRTNNPPISKTSDGVLFSRSILVLLANCMQLSTACAHAADYPRYPANLVRLYAADLAESCESSAAFLDGLSI